MKNKWFWCSLLLTVFFCSCGDDDVLPSYRQDLAELTTDGEGKAECLHFDDGRVLPVSNYFGGLVPDSLYRIQALYIEDETTAVLEGAAAVVSSYPVDMPLPERKTDPLELKALWESPRYINFLVGVKTGGGKQALGFMNYGTEEMSGGIRKMKLVLFHDQNKDSLYYTQEAYLSCPIYQYGQDLRPQVDSIEMEVHTFEGIVRKSFLYR